MRDTNYTQSALLYEFGLPLTLIAKLYGIGVSGITNNVYGKHYTSPKLWSDLSDKEKTPHIREAKKFLEVNNLQNFDRQAYQQGTVAIQQAMFYGLKLSATTISKIFKAKRRSVISHIAGENRLLTWEDRSPVAKAEALDLARLKFREWLNDRE